MLAGRTEKAGKNHYFDQMSRGTAMVLFGFQSASYSLFRTTSRQWQVSSDLTAYQAASGDSSSGGAPRRHQRCWFWPRLRNQAGAGASGIPHIILRITLRPFMGKKFQISSVESLLQHGQIKCFRRATQRARARTLAA